MTSTLFVYAQSFVRDAEMKCLMRTHVQLNLMRCGFLAKKNEENWCDTKWGMNSKRIGPRRKCIQTTTVHWPINYSNRTCVFSSFLFSDAKKNFWFTALMALFASVSFGFQWHVFLTYKRLCGVRSRCRRFLNQFDTCVNVSPVFLASIFFSSGVGYLFQSKNRRKKMHLEWGHECQMRIYIHIEFMVFYA